MNQSLLLNENLKIVNKPLYNKHFIDKGILYIKNILDGNGNFLDYAKMMSKFSLNITSKIPDGKLILLNYRYKYSKNNMQRFPLALISK